MKKKNKINNIRIDRVNRDIYYLGIVDCFIEIKNKDMKKSKPLYEG